MSASDNVMSTSTDEAGTTLLRLSSRVYEKDAVTAAAYTVTDRCIVDVEPLDDGDWGVRLRAKNSADARDLSAIANELRNEVVDQQLRLDLEKRYGSLRDTIVLCAFDPINASGKKKQSWVAPPTSLSHSPSVA